VWEESFLFFFFAYTVQRSCTNVAARRDFPAKTTALNEFRT
jgi:hypothetical protein